MTSSKTGIDLKFTITELEARKLQTKDTEVLQNDRQEQNTNLTEHKSSTFNNSSNPGP